MAESTSLVVGSRVILHSLKANPELNNQAGTLLRFVPKRKRWAVRVDHQDFKDPVMILPEKLTLIVPDPPAEEKAVVEPALAEPVSVVVPEPAVVVPEPAALSDVSNVKVEKAVAAPNKASLPEPAAVPVEPTDAPSAAVVAPEAEPEAAAVPQQELASKKTALAVTAATPPVVALANANPAIAWLLQTFCCVEKVDAQVPLASAPAATPNTVYSLKS